MRIKGEINLILCGKVTSIYMKHVAYTLAMVCNKRTEKVEALSVVCISTLGYSTDIFNWQVSIENRRLERVYHNYSKLVYYWLNYVRPFVVYIFAQRVPAAFIAILTALLAGRNTCSESGHFVHVINETSKMQLNLNWNHLRTWKEQFMSSEIDIVPPALSNCPQ